MKTRATTPWLVAALCLCHFSCSESQTLEDAERPVAVKVNKPEFGGSVFVYQVPSSVEGIVDREVTIVLPRGYSNEQRYPVLYMMDGQNCFSWSEYGHGGWEVHRTSEKLMDNGEIDPLIVVCVANGESRRRYEYSPTVWGESPFNGETGGGGPDFVRFLITDVIPLVEAEYSVKGDPSHRAIGGASFGGLISFFAAWDYPHVFGKAFAMSSVFAWDDEWALTRAASTANDQTPDIKLYLDSGTALGFTYSFALDRFQDDAMAITADLKDILVDQRGFVEGENLMHFVDQDGLHNERYWRGRFHLPLKFLFGVARAMEPTGKTRVAN